AIAVDVVPADEGPGERLLDAVLAQKGLRRAIDLVPEPAHRGVGAREEGLLAEARGEVLLARLLGEDMLDQPRVRLLEARQPAAHEQRRPHAVEHHARSSAHGARVSASSTRSATRTHGARARCTRLQWRR